MTTVVSRLRRRSIEIVVKLHPLQALVVPNSSLICLFRTLKTVKRNPVVPVERPRGRKEDNDRCSPLIKVSRITTLGFGGLSLGHAGLYPWSNVGLTIQDSGELARLVHSSLVLCLSGNRILVTQAISDKPCVFWAILSSRLAISDSPNLARSKGGCSSSSRSGPHPSGEALPVAAWNDYRKDTWLA